MHIFKFSRRKNNKTRGHILYFAQRLTVAAENFTLYLTDWASSALHVCTQRRAMKRL